MEKFLTVTIDDLDMNANGIAHKNEKTIFVDGALKDEQVECEIIKEKQNLIFAKNTKIIKSSPFRINPLCPYFSECGGCDIQHLKYEKGLEFKKNQIKIAFKKIANIILPDFEIESSQNQYHYRNKIALKICEINGEKILCYYKKNSHNPLKISNCVIANEKFKFVIENVNKFLKTNNLAVYDEKTKQGEFKHLVARIIDNNLMLTFVLKNNKSLQKIEELQQILLTSFNKVGININVNKNNKEILSNKFINLVGNNTINFENLNIKQKISNASFLQVNTLVANKIYSYVLKNVSEIVVNAYSGAGLLSAIIAKNSPKNQVFGIEINKIATRMANDLKLENSIENLANFCGDAGEILDKLNLKDFDLIVDPPKSGMDSKMLNAIKKFLPKKLIYISCDKISLAKNINQLKCNYLIKQIKAFDMFPQTKNVETVVILERI